MPTTSVVVFVWVSNTLFSVFFLNVQALCSWDPSKRPSAAEALQHPFFQVYGVLVEDIKLKSIDCSSFLETNAVFAFVCCSFHLVLIKSVLLCFRVAIMFHHPFVTGQLLLELLHLVCECKIISALINECLPKYEISNNSIHFIFTQLEQEYWSNNNVVKNKLGLYLTRNLLATFLRQSCRLLQMLVITFPFDLMTCPCWFW